MKVEVKRKSGDIALTVTVPAEKVKEVFAQVKEAALKEVSVSGFRKGKAPEKVAETHLNEDRMAEALFNRLIPSAYAEALGKENIKPVIPPQLKVISFKKDADLVFEARTAERPEVKLGEYGATLKTLKGRVIYGPDGKPVKGGAKITADQVLDKLREIVNIEIPPVMIDQEVQRMLSSLLRQTQTLGITIEQYLASEGKTIDQLRKEYRQMAEKTLRNEFVLDEVASKEGIKAEANEVEGAIKAAPDEKSREMFSREDGRRYIGGIIQRRKTIEYLLRITEGKDS